MYTGCSKYFSPMNQNCLIDAVLSSSLASTKSRVADTGGVYLDPKSTNKLDPTIEENREKNPDPDPA